MRTGARAIALVVAAAVISAAACSGSRGSAELPPDTPRPLAGLTAQPLIILPAHYLRGGDSTGWGARIGASREYLAAFDSTLEAVFRARNVPDSWDFPPELARAAQRNAGYLANPYQLAAQGLRPTTRSMDTRLTDPLASQMRAWVAINGSRIALLPVELRFEGTADSARAVMRVVVIDARLAQVSWMADVRGEYRAAPDTSVLATLARQVAELVLPP